MRPFAMEFYRPTIAEIALKSLDHNLAAVRARIPAGTGVMAMVKADAYGHGAVSVARRLTKAGVEAFGVATVEEGSELREAGIAQPIVVMGGLMGQGARAAGAIMASSLVPVIHTVDTIAPLERAAKSSGKRCPVHLKVDTGMTRLGALPGQARMLLERIGQSSPLQLQGIMTHLAFAADAEATRAQWVAFSKFAGEVRDRVGPDVTWHMANSAAILRGEPITVATGMKTWVRPGIMLYGIAPYPEDIGRCELIPVMRLKSQVVLIKQVRAGTAISYGCTWRAARPSRIAVVPIGYADGYPWALTNSGMVLIEGVRYPVVGRVTMDFLMVDVTDGARIGIGAEVVLLGTQAGAAVSAEELATLAGTIPYEIVCRVSKRMPREYYD
ncbi:MAG: alanine racemase [Deltaproteobacteria bacterium]|nr:alanine racemase [Deltaproteobacteria bacterium]